ncbi:ornithine cyclodeaminase family protein [Rugamonas sp. A1-17]|nr:ornithine cyclodeaminase family protein [Rugamonas sp. A1-17]
MAHQAHHEAVEALPPTLFLTDADVGAASDWAAAASALRAAYRAPHDEAMVPPRAMARADGRWLRTLSAASPSGGHMGAKLICASTRNRKASYLVALFEQESCRLRALIDGNRVTALRTAATSAVAIDALAPQRPLKVALLGSGFEAHGQLHALAALRRIESVKVYSPTPANRQRFADDNGRALDLQVQALDSAREAVRGADVVICAARSRDESPALLGEWLEPGMTVVSIGSTLPEQREVDTEAIRRAGVIVADMVHEVADDTGDMLAATREQVPFREKIHSLAELLRAPQAVRAAGDIALYKSVGSALQDVVVAEMLLERALQLGLGTPLPVTIAPVGK